MIRRLEVSSGESYVHLEDEVIVEAGFCGECHNKKEPYWEVAAQAVLSLRKEEKEKYDMLLKQMRKTALEYHRLKEAIEKILPEDNERETILAEL